MLQSDKSGLGFTLVELLVVIAILALMMGILMPTYQKQQSPADARHNGKVNVALLTGIPKGYPLKNSDTCEMQPGPSLPTTRAGAIACGAGRGATNLRPLQRRRAAI